MGVSGWRHNKVPSRVRIVASHPVYGKFLGTGAFRTIEERCKVDNYHIPVMFASWPRWKRVMWLAKGEGKWKIKVFREPRGTKLRKSLYGKEKIGRASCRERV